jgi:Uma2 family endonuclease
MKLLMEFGRTFSHRLLVAPMDIYFNEDNIFQPDVIYISNENAKIIKPNRIEGAPDLVIEILSPSTSTNDKINKKNKYAQFGVHEYWIVDPVHLYVDQFILERNNYLLYHTFGARDILTSPRFTCIYVDLPKLFSRLLSPT